MKGTNLIMIIAIAFIVLMRQTEGKVVTCKNKFKKDGDDWYYCTKFGAPKNGKIKFKTRAKFTTQY